MNSTTGTITAAKRISSQLTLFTPCSKAVAVRSWWVMRAASVPK